MPRYHLIVYVPIAAADTVRSALAEVGAGTIGNYDHCSFSSRGIGRFRPLKGAKPALGNIGHIEEVEEERIEAVIETKSEAQLRHALEDIRAAHPYEEPAIHVLPMIER